MRFGRLSNFRMDRILRRYRRIKPAMTKRGVALGLSIRKARMSFEAFFKISELFVVLNDE